MDSAQKEVSQFTGPGTSVTKDLNAEIPRQADGIQITHDGNAVAVSSPVKGAILLTNKIGGRILGLIDGKRSVAAIGEILANEFPGVESSKLREHVANFVIKGEQKGVLSFSKTELSLKVLNSTPSTGNSNADVVFEEDRKFHPDIYWYLTFRCNLACIHCSVFSSPYVDNSTDLKTNDCLDVVEQLAEMNVSMAMLSGGEALIRPDALKIIRALGEKNIYVGLETNGLKVTEKAFIELVLELQARKLMNVTISLDGGTAETHSVLRGQGSFERTVRGMRTLHEHGIIFDIQCVLNRDNYHTIPNLYDLAAEVQPDALNWLPLNSAGRGSELIKKLGLGYAETVEILELVDRYKGRFSGTTVMKLPPAMVPPKYMLQVFKGQDVGCCTSCKFPLLGILPNGDITVCGVSRNDPTLYFGNVREIRMKDAWTKARMDLLRTRYVAAEELRGICGDCVWKSSCKGSCRAKAYDEGGDFFSPYPVCQEAAERGEFPDVYRISKGAYARPA
jgi:radical SAM protein with 4Fe4S-binding SPASM domain